jgi:hypothetical protein
VLRRVRRDNVGATTASCSARAYDIGRLLRRDGECVQFGQRIAGNGGAARQLVGAFCCRVSIRKSYRFRQEGIASAAG